MGTLRRIGVAMGLALGIFLSGCTKTPPTPQEILAQGTDAWNTWRSENPETIPDLSGLVMENANLPSINFEKMRLAGVRLPKANLAGALMRGADLAGADLSGANLKGADLSSSNLEGAKLVGAALNDAQFDEATLSQADLAEADLTASDLSNATIDAISNWESVKSFKDTNIYRVVLAPSGFKDLALSKGARKDG